MKILRSILILELAFGIGILFAGSPNLKEFLHIAEAAQIAQAPVDSSTAPAVTPNDSSASPASVPTSDSAGTPSSAATDSADNIDNSGNITNFPASSTPSGADTFVDSSASDSDNIDNSSDNNNSENTNIDNPDSNTAEISSPPANDPDIISTAPADTQDAPSAPVSSVEVEKITDEIVSSSPFLTQLAEDLSEVANAPTPALVSTARVEDMVLDSANTPEEKTADLVNMVNNKADTFFTNPSSSSSSDADFLNSRLLNQLDTLFSVKDSAETSDKKAVEQSLKEVCANVDQSLRVAALAGSEDTEENLEITRSRCYAYAN